VLALLDQDVARRIRIVAVIELLRTHLVGATNNRHAQIRRLPAGKMVLTASKTIAFAAFAISTVAFPLAR
jgi:hypothetical protein